ncbi:MAG: DUF1698 domain-containing protein [Campylobacterales bacterium]
MASALEAVRRERERWMGWKNIAPLREALASLPDIAAQCEYGDIIRLSSEEKVDLDEIERVARMMMPWRKGPFDFFGLFIDTEWQSFMKYNLLRPHFNLEGKRVADIGCNNGYYLFRMQEDAPAKLVGFDPSALYKTQFDFINHFAKTEIVYELLGVEHLPLYEEKFDTLFCLGVLYHRSDPVAMLKQLNWCLRAGFTGFEVLETSLTTSDEQRKTAWIEGQSLEDFLDPDDPSKTVEGNPAPKRVYVRLTKEPKT